MDYFFVIIYGGFFIMQNNKMHFKMYKSGKNWMVAGLMTTAVLAGLTLSNTNNDVVAHAADNALVAANKDAATTTDAQQTPADKAYNDAINDQNVKYIDAKNAAKADQDAANQAANKAATSAQAAADLKTAAQTAVNDAQTALDNANHQLQRDLSAYRHNNTHENAVAVNNSKAAANAAQSVLDNMNNYDAYLAAKDNENDKLNALQDAQKAEANESNDWTEEALSKAQSDYDDAQAATIAAKAKVADKLNLANSRDQLKTAKDAANKAYNDQVAYINQLENGLNGFSHDFETTQKALKDAQKKVDDTQNAITDADNDMHDNIKPAKDAADKAYNDQVSYINMLEDHLNNVTSPQLEASKKATADATKAHDDAVNEETKAHDVLAAANDNVAKAQKLVNDAKDAQNDAESLVEKANDLLHNIDWSKANNAAKDNTDLQNQINDLKNRVSSLEQQIAALKNNGVANNTAANKTVEASAVATPAAVTMTRAEYKNAQNNNAAKSNNLPQTGNENSAAVMALGAVSAMLGLGMVAKKREF